MLQEMEDWTHVSYQLSWGQILIIRIRRKELKLSVDELALRLNKDRATIYRYENGDIENLPTTIIEPLATALETTPEYLMGWANSTNMVGKVKLIHTKDEFRLEIDGNKILGVTSYKIGSEANSGYIDLELKLTLDLDSIEIMKDSN